MIAEDVLERGLAAAADDYDVPAGAVDKIRAELTPKAEANRPHLPRPTRRGWWTIGAGLAAGRIAVPIALGGGATTSDGGGETAASGSPSRVEGPNETAGGGTTTSDKSARRLSGGALQDAPAVAPTPVGRAPAIPDAVGAGSGADTFGPVTGTGTGAAASGSGGHAALDPPPSLQERVIKTGQLDLQVPRGEVTTTLNRLTALATFMRGYVADSVTSEGGSAPSGQMTLRVPVANFEPTITRARTYGEKVLSLETSSQDVTNKYVDLAARISALKQTRSTFLTLLSKATTIGETLAVQQHVTDVQTQIEQLQGQLRVLGNRSAMSTLTVTVDQKVTPVATHHERTGISKAFHTSVDRFVNGIEAIVAALGPLLLAALLIGAGWLLARFAYKRFRRRLV
jgi:hypothetical protein